MTQPVQLRRLLLVGFSIVAGFIGLGCKLFELQVLKHEVFLEQAKNNVQRKFLKRSRRGDIRDARGTLLATSKMVKTVCADPSIVGTNSFLIARQVAPLLQMDRNEVEEKLRPRYWTNQEGQVKIDQYVVLKRKVEEESWLQIRKVMSDLDFGPEEKKLPERRRGPYNRVRQRALFAEQDELRVYPNNSLAAHVIGYVGVEDQGEEMLEMVGRDGVEFSMNTALTGVRGWRQTQTDSLRRELVPFREQEVTPRNGLNVVLTLEAGLQHIAESELEEAVRKHSPVSATCLIVRPRTGEILALANFPNFDLNDPGASPPEARRNRLISDISEPGSTFKIVVVSAALNEKLVRPNESIDCGNGIFYFAGRPLRDDHSFGVITVSQIISKSSNIGSAKIGIRLGSEKLYAYMRGFGFGQRTGIPLLGEVNGTVHPTKAWSKLSISRIPMGHEVAVTHLQMAMAMAAIGNGGVLMKPMIVSRLEDDNGQVVLRHNPQPVRRVISEEAARDMAQMLKAVVATNGTGFRAELARYTVAGKTGTAQKPGRGGYMPGKYVSSFIGFLPAEKPELCISVMLDEPRHGYYAAETAAPVFQRIADRAANYLAIPPDRHPKETFAANNSPTILQR